MEFELTESFSVPPSVIYHAWLDSDLHMKMTGGEASCSNQIGSSFSAWDGYILGKNLELIENEKIVQSWRTSEFSSKDEDSIITIYIRKTPNGTELTLHHKNIPKGQMTQYKKGWVEHYFTPMKEFFEK